MNMDQLAVEAAKDPQAFGQLYDSLYSRIYNYIRYRCDDLASAEDLTAQTFERLLAALEAYNPERGPFEPYAFAVARNLVTSHYRKQSLRAWLPWEAFQNRPDPRPMPEEATLLREAEADLLKAMQGLKPQLRDLLGLKYASGLANPEIAALTGLSEGNVAVILHRALETLRLKLSPAQPAEMSTVYPKEAEHAGQKTWK